MELIVIKAEGIFLPEPGKAKSLGGESAIRESLEVLLPDLEWEEHDFGGMLGVMAPIAQKALSGENEEIFALGHAEWSGQPVEVALEGLKNQVERVTFRLEDEESGFMKILEEWSASHEARVWNGHSER